MKKQSLTPKKKTANVTGEDWDLYPIGSNHNIVRLPLFDEEFEDTESITFDKSKSTFSIAELKTSDSGLISGTCILHLGDTDSYTINLTYKELCKILFS